MKKLSILLILLVVPFFASAAELEVETLEASVSGTTISYTGTMQDGSLATTCMLLNSKNEEVDKLSTQVDNKKFSGEFIVVYKGEYTVSCADFDGGNVKNVTVTVAAGENAKTGDNIFMYVGILVVSIIGVAGGAFYLTKKSK